MVSRMGMVGPVLTDSPGRVESEVARLSTPPDDAEMRLLRDRATAIDPLLEVDFDTQRDVEQDLIHFRNDTVSRHFSLVWDGEEGNRDFIIECLLNSI